MASPDTSKRGRKAPDAMALLRADHHVGELFAAHEGPRPVPKTRVLVAQIGTGLSVHAEAEAEAEIFYPAVKPAPNDKELVPRATVEHAALEALNSRIEGIGPGDGLFDARVTVLAEYATHQVKEEQSEMFRRAKACQLDMAALGSRLAARRQQLLAAAG